MVTPMSAEQDPASQPDRIGPYRILETLGEGGMGIVYLSEQTHPIRRRVALKLIKLGMDSKAVLTRFDAERQALALMEHENIAKVLDAGLAENGRPYFAMEYVNGPSLTQYCAEHHLGLRDRLELFRQICAGVQHAHQKGVIHRDLKPANVLITQNEGQPVPKIIDFGLARATNQRLVEVTMFTEQGQVLGTPAYMSPEQTDLGTHDIDTRTDVYSLGVMLYELLVGELPYPTEVMRRVGLLEVQRMIREVEPPRPSSRISAIHRVLPTPPPPQPNRHAWMRVLRGDLDWIVLCALEKDPNRRYQTALAFAEDLGRHLRSEPVAARPPSLGYRCSKFVRKHRVSMAAAALVLATVVVGVVVSVYLLFEAQKARGTAERVASASQLQLARMEMIAIDQAAFWTARAFEEARAPSMAEVERFQVDGRPVLNGMQLPARDPWGNPYRLVAAGQPGDWLVECSGPNGRLGDDDDLTEHARVYTIDTQQRLTRLFEQRAGRALDFAQDWLLQRRTITEPGEFDARGLGLVDPWGNGLVPVPADNQLLVHSPGPDREYGTRDDLEMRREIIPVTVAPEEVRTQVGRCHRIFCVVPLRHVAAASVVASLRSYVAERTGIAPGLKVDTVGAKGVGLLGPPEQVAILLEHVKQIDRAG